MALYQIDPSQTLHLFVIFVEEGFHICLRNLPIVWMARSFNGSNVWKPESLVAHIFHHPSSSAICSSSSIPRSFVWPSLSRRASIRSRSQLTSTSWYDSRISRISINSRFNANIWPGLLITHFFSILPIRVSSWPICCSSWVARLTDRVTGGISMTISWIRLLVFWAHILFISFSRFWHSSRSWLIAILMS